MVNIGRVEGEYRYDPSVDAVHPHIRTVKWLKSLPRTKFSQGALHEIGSAITLFQVRNFADEFLAALRDEAPASEVEEDETVRIVVHGDFGGPLAGAVAPAESETAELPLYGRIAAGTPIEALRDYSSTVQVPVSRLGPGEYYALEVAGDSMAEAGILDGDTVILERVDIAENGSIVVALIDDEEVTLKRLRSKGQSVALEPANKDFETRIFGPDRVKVQGRLIGLIRKY